MSNPSGIAPLGRAVLVLPDHVEEVTKGGIIIPDNSRERMAMMEMKATVIAVGAEAWRDERQPRAVPGDRVIFSKWAGHSLTGTADGKVYRVVNDSDIFVRLDIEAPKEK